MKTPTHILALSTRKLLRPLVRLLLRAGMPFGEFAEHAKGVYVEVAMRDFRVETRKPSISRTAIITGLTRKDVSRLAAANAIDDVAGVEHFNRAARVIQGWVQDPHFLTADGQPARLFMTTGEKSFSELVRLHGGDVPMRAVLDELLRVGAIVRDEDGSVRLKTRAYVPAEGHSEKLGILGRDVAELISTIDHNLTQPPEAARFQRKVSYDHLPYEFLASLRVEAADLGQALLEKLDRSMSEQDRDANPNAEGTGRARASIGIYYYESQDEE